jgi:hypothetical protein
MGGMTEMLVDSSHQRIGIGAINPDRFGPTDQPI